MEKFQLAIIGAGPGGYVAAIRAAQLGLKTVLIEKNDSLGGTCLNIGCIPSKALLESSEHYTAARHQFAKHGIQPGDVKLDLIQMMKRKAEIVKTLTDGVAALMKKNRIMVLKGIGRLRGEGRIEVLTTPPLPPPAERGGENTEILADNIVLAMGSLAVELPFMPFDSHYIVSSTEALSFNEIPQSLIVIGAGAIGLELGSVWARLGAKVTILEMLPQIALYADKQMATMLQRALAAQGMVFNLDSKVTSADIKNGKITVHYQDKTGNVNAVEGDKVLVAVGRKPNSCSCGLEEAGVQINPDGRIPVNEHWQTNLPGVYAIGDLIAGPMLAHKASDEGIVVAETIARKPGHINYNAIPSVIYTNPELASVGLSEEQAQAQGLKYNTGKFFFRGNGRALSMGETEGLVKILAQADTNRILGAHILGPRASELIPELTLAMELNASAEDIARSCHAHPTLSEAVREAALAVNKRQIHG